MLASLIDAQKRLRGCLYGEKKELTEPERALLSREISRACCNGEAGAMEEIVRWATILAYHLRTHEFLLHPRLLGYSRISSLVERDTLLNYTLRYFTGQGGDLVGSKEARTTPELARCFRLYLGKSARRFAEEFRRLGAELPEGKRACTDFLFLQAYDHLVGGEYLKCSAVIKGLLERLSKVRCRTYFPVKLHLLSLASCCSYRMGSFYDAVYFSHAGISLSASAHFFQGEAYFHETLFVVERDAGVFRTHFPLSASLAAHMERTGASMERRGLQDKIYRSKTYAREKSLLREVKLHDNRERVKYGNKAAPEGNSIVQFIGKIGTCRSIAQEISTVFIYSIEGRLALGVIDHPPVRPPQGAGRAEALPAKGKGKGKFFVLETDLVVEEMLREMKEVGLKNRLVLKRACATEEDKQEWWRARIELDRRIGSMLAKIDRWLRKFERHSMLLKSDVALVLEDVLGVIPFEMCPSFRSRGVSRCPSLGFVLEEAQCLARAESEVVPQSKCFYVLDPEDNLPHTAEKVGGFLSRSFPGMGAIAKRVPAPEEVEARISASTLFFYFGHGGGEKYFSYKALQRRLCGKSEGAPKRIFLFGCSSSKLAPFSNYNVNSTSLSYLFIPGVRTVVGSLWDVTDKDIDNLSIGLINGLAQGGRAISRIVNDLRYECRLKYLNGASIVVYGGICDQLQLK